MTAHSPSSPAARPLALLWPPAPMYGGCGEHTLARALGGGIPHRGGTAASFWTWQRGKLSRLPTITTAWKTPRSSTFRDASRPLLRRMTLVEMDATRPLQESDVRNRRGNDRDQGEATSGTQRRSNEGRTRHDARVCRGVGAGRRCLRRRGGPRDPSAPARPRRARDTGGGIVDEVVTKVRDACGVPVGGTTSAEIEPDPERRLELVRAWHTPDYTSVNVSEMGAAEVIETLIEAGIGVEAGVWTVKDVEWLAASGVGDRLTPILVEPGELQLLGSEDKAADAFGLVEDIHEALDRFGLTAPRLQHGDGEVTWALLADAIRRGLDTRIGREDTLHGPTGERTSGNEALVRAARELAPTRRKVSLLG